MNMMSLAPTSLWDVKPVEFLEVSAQAGFDGVGLRLNPSPHRQSHPVVGDKALIAEMQHRISDTGLQVLDVFTFYMLPQIDFDQYQKAMELGAAFGARYCMVNCDDPDWSRMRDNFVRFCDMAAQFGLGAAVEFAPVHHLSTLQKAVALLQEAGRDNAGLVIDPLHFARSGGRVEELDGLDPALFPYAQLADGVMGPGEPPAVLGPQMGGGERCLTGHGTMPLAELLDALPAGIPLSIECLPRPEGMSPLEWAQKIEVSTRDFLQRYYGRNA